MMMAQRFTAGAIMQGLQKITTTENNNDNHK